MSRTIEEYDAEIVTGAIFAYQLSGEPATLCIGIEKGKVRPTMWLSYDSSVGNKTFVLAAFYGSFQAATTAKFFDQHSDAVQSVINHYAKKEKGND